MSKLYLIIIMIFFILLMTIICRAGYPLQNRKNGGNQMHPKNYINTTILLHYSCTALVGLL